MKLVSLIVSHYSALEYSTLLHLLEFILNLGIAKPMALVREQEATTVSCYSLPYFGASSQTTTMQTCNSKIYPSVSQSSKKPWGIV